MAHANSRTLVKLPSRTASSLKSRSAPAEALAPLAIDATTNALLRRDCGLRKTVGTGQNNASAQSGALRNGWAVGEFSETLPLAGTQSMRAMGRDMQAE